ncbi:hypothetical protein ACJ3XI_07835 [Litorimonas sp. RW-G-Af-16]|uniref:[protein-PII] uridylyltransferase family protein n=1 Tax=Litorimonas sp. RW-G-Af-16 TaxID=3241168 RepID=UPI00390C45FF
MAALAQLSPTDPDFVAKLYALKSHFDLAWAALALMPDNDFSTLGILRSDFAAKSIDKALHAAWHQELAAQRVPDIPLTSLFILGLGKLGGFDLNFSSDVDLIAFYDAETLPISANKGQKYVINKVLQRLGKILKPNHSAEFVWRVDWRLRPESSSGGLSMTTDEASAFYFFRALPWHRLALMKARVVAGDKSVGAEFLNDIAPFIWRQNLDFRALDELAHLKTRINLEHPGLQQERAQPDPIIPDPIGFNVKLGSGGIREIEFIANAQQLVWGGKQYELRTPNTLKALQSLASLGHMDDRVCGALSEHYIALRRLENAIQMLGNEQTHMVPDAPYPLSQIAQVLGYADWESYAPEIYTRRNVVNKHFDALFHAEAKPDDSARISTADLSDVSQAIANSWLGGFNAHGVARDRLSRYQPLGQSLLNRVINSSADANAALPRIDSFLKSIARSEQYLRLLQRNSKLLDALIVPLLYSPHMTRLLEQSPHIIDVFLDPQSLINTGLTPNTDFIFTDPDYETRLERLRRFVNENLFQAYHAFFNHSEEDFGSLPRRLTDLADRTIEAAIKIVCDDLKIEDVEICVLGLGKMATQHMAPMSDIDLIFIFGDAVESELSAKIVRRLRTTLTTPLREGIAYDLDMRLRPSGRSGPPAVKLSSFKDYHATRAKTWEHIALYKARIIAGDPNFAPKVQAAIDAVMSRPRNRKQCLIDAKYMLNLIAKERFTETPLDVFNTKLRRGGLMEADFLWRTYSVAGLNWPTPLWSAMEEWRTIELWERLLGLTGQSFDAVPNRFRADMHINGMAQRNQRRERAVSNARQSLFSTYSVPDDYEMRPVRWEDE